MKKIVLLFVLFAFAATTTFAQEDMTLEQLKAKKAELQAKFDAASAEAGAAQSELDALQKEINILSGWMFGLSGLVGLNFAGSNQWMANPNPTSRSTGLSIGLGAYANLERKKYFWNNKLIINKAWQRVDTRGNNDTKFFDKENGTVDLLNISSLAGYKVTEKFAISALGEFNSSIGNFLEPATLDFGVGGTWKPITNMTVVIHPLNYHIAWSAQDDIDVQGALGAKIRVDYQNEFKIAGRPLNWSTTLTSFVPYSSKKTALNDVDKYGETIYTIPGDESSAPITREAGLFEVTWLNTVSYQVWKGIGLGANFGLRKANFEHKNLQTFYGVGLTYTL